MQNFLEHDRVEPDKRGEVERIRDFNEIYGVLSKKEASFQSTRCVQCSNPYCSHGCPLDNHIPQWLKAVANKNLELAFTLTNKTSPFPEIMGKVCPQDRLCEKTCTLNEGFGAVTIGFVENYINQQGFERNLQVQFSKNKLGKKVSIVGSGPAGLSVATFLLRAGFDVEIYERDDRAGGLLTYGIPNFKLHKTDVERRVNILLEQGMKLHLNKEVGQDISFEDLRKNSDAVFVGIGATGAKEIDIANKQAKNVYKAMEVLIDVQKSIFNNTAPKIELKNKRVVVIGAGDTAMDCVRTSIRERAADVKCLYRRDEESMPGSLKEHLNAKQEGVEFVFHLSPSEIKVNDKNEVTSIVMQKTAFKDGKLEALDEYEEIEADIVIFSLGFNVVIPSFIKDSGVKLDEYGNIALNDYRTSEAKVYAGGDCFRGSDLVVNAALDGREAARAIMEDLQI